ncbi:calcium-activated potassium channel slowpoke-like [Sitodiplosis mosellana]|uniref:calcium-activated potassium channel slowpoke-like n=1 Tax=Sitodiplosis mosellana TaxID=263140 RepID=UPI002444636A|nr:calcium-activated potassium channel slowpoke-like [Sitodiplosis mosellana]
MSHTLLTHYLMSHISLNSTTIANVTNVANISYLSAEEICLNERKWWMFLLSSLISFSTGILIVLLWRIFAFFFCHKPELSENEEEPEEDQEDDVQINQEFGWLKTFFHIHAKINTTKSGRILLVLVFILNVASFIIYLIDTITTKKYVERCVPFNESITQRIDFALNNIFLVFFFIRLSYWTCLKIITLTIVGDVHCKTVLGLTCFIVSLPFHLYMLAGVTMQIIYVIEYELLDDIEEPIWSKLAIMFRINGT